MGKLICVETAQKDLLNKDVIFVTTPYLSAMIKFSSGCPKEEALEHLIGYLKRVEYAKSNAGF